MSFKRLLKCIFSVVVLFAFSTTNAQNMTIKRLTTPTINIGGKTLKVGDSFSRQSVVNWANDKQAMIAQDAAGKMYRLAAASVQGKPGFSFEKLLGIQKNYQHLSTRALGDDVEIDGEYIIEDKVEIPTGLDDEVEYEVELLFKDGDELKTYKPQLSLDKTSAIVKSDIFDGCNAKELKVKMFAIPKGDERFCISEDIVLISFDNCLEEY